MFNLCIVFDHLPYSELSPNARKHWRSKAKIAQIARYEAYNLGLQNKGTWQAPEKAKIYYKFYSNNKRIKDLDNLVSAAKPFCDGLVDAGILSHDDGWHLSIGGAELIESSQNETWLIVEALDAPLDK